MLHFHIETLVGNVNTASICIRTAIPQDVDELQCLTETAGERQHFLKRLRGIIRHMLEAQTRPEFANAAGDKIGVFLQFLRGQRCGRRVGGGSHKALHIENLALKNNTPLSNNLIALRKSFQRLQQTRHEIKQLTLGPAETKIGRLLWKKIGQAAQKREALEVRRGRGVGDGVRSPRQHVGQREGRTELCRQNAQRELKRAGNPLQQFFEGIGVQHREGEWTRGGFFLIHSQLQ